MEIWKTGENPIPLPLCPPKIPHFTWTTLGVNLGLCTEKLATAYLCCGKAQKHSVTVRKAEIVVLKGMFGFKTCSNKRVDKITE
jgi:hypothetical protein